VSALQAAGGRFATAACSCGRRCGRCSRCSVCSRSRWGCSGIVAGLLGGGAISPAGLPACARPSLRIYEDAGRVYGVNPFLLMAVHEDESSLSNSTLPGVASGVNFAGCCAGPMQFYIAGGASPAANRETNTFGSYEPTLSRCRRASRRRK
jgi:hypothetical protein